MGNVHRLLHTVPSLIEQLTIHQLLILAGIITLAVWFILVASGRRYS